MRIYFVRHGESEANAAKRGQGAKGPLSAQGRAQAEALAKRLAHEEVELIISSDYERAIETASIIATTLNKPTDRSPLLGERQYPSTLIDTDLESEEAKQLISTFIRHPNGEEWKHSDEENFLELKNRAQAAQEFITSQAEERVVIVSHADFIRFFVAYLAFGPEMSTRESVHFRHFMSIKNTGLTVIEYKQPDEELPEPRWKLITWNDHAHLG